MSWLPHLLEQRAQSLAKHRPQSCVHEGSLAERRTNNITHKRVRYNLFVVNIYILEVSFHYSMLGHLVILSLRLDLQVEVPGLLIFRQLLLGSKS